MSFRPSLSALDCIESQFQALTTSMRPLYIDGFEVGHGLPDRLVPLNEVRDVLAERSASNDLKDAVWSVLVCRANTDQDRWGIGAAGVMMRGLRSIATRVSRGAEFQRNDLQGEIVLGFYEALRSLDPNARGLAGLLWWAAYRRGIAARQAERDAAGYALSDSDVLRNQRIKPPEGHPDLVLIRAVGDGVLDPGEAELIGDTRVGGHRLIAASRRFGMSYGSCHKRRSRAEQRLARYLGHRLPIQSDDEDPPPLPVAA